RRIRLSNASTFRRIRVLTDPRPCDPGTRARRGNGLPSPAPAPHGSIGGDDRPTGPDPAWSTAMAESVPVRCPACRRAHAVTTPTYPCSCGAPLTIPVLRGGVPTQVRQRTWRNSWVTVNCPSCGRGDDWPQPELGCPCGA